MGARKIQEHLGEGVRRTLEETLNAMLDAEADRLCRAERYERTEARKDTRACSYQRRLQTKAGEVSLKVPKLRNLSLANCYFTHDSSVFPVLRRFRDAQSSRSSRPPLYIYGCRTGGRRSGAIVGPKNEVDDVKVVTVNA